MSTEDEVDLIRSTMPSPLPHQRYGITLGGLADHELASIRSLAMTETTFLEATTCGKELTTLTAISDDSVLSRSQGVTPDVCVKCSRKADATVKRCKYTATESNGKVSYSLATYTDAACTTGEGNVTATTEVTAGECVDDTVSFDLVTVNDFKSFVKTGLTYVEYSNGTCDTPVAYETVGYVGRQCYGSKKQSVRYCDGSTMEISTYEKSDCTGAVKQTISKMDQCFIPANGEHNFTSADGMSITEGTRMKKYCNELYPFVHVSTSKFLSGDAIFSVVIGSVFMAAVLGGLVFYYFKEKAYQESSKAELHATSERKREQEQASAYRGKSKSVTSINAAKGPTTNNPMLNKGISGPSPLTKKGGLGGKGPARV
jgi:hypothetical protein